MIRIKVGTFDYDLKDLNEGELIKQVIERRKDNVPVCVQVTIKTGNLNMILATPDCASGGGNRPPTDEEKSIYDLWDKFSLGSKDYSPGNLIAFLKQIQSMC
tara:strand:- start:2439 stop:2744 length:306 start_codon:yes stop_codon:yes gene_type:complete